jgi:predicted transposase/invertase (TIGR01784 family)
VRRDSIFYKLFQQSPSLLFEMVNDPPDRAAQYTFDSVAVKEPTFTIDGVFLPPKRQKRGVVYFCEIQFQKDEQLYERLFGESLLYFYRNRRRFDDWRAVVIYPTRSKEQSIWHPYADLINGPRVHRIYLDELGDMQDVPIGLALMMLTNTKKRQAPEAARQLLARSHATGSKTEIRAIMDMVTTIMVYQFSKLSQQEVEKMLGIEAGLRKTRVYQEAKAEGEQEGIEKGIQKGRQEGIQEGRQEERLALVLQLLNQRFGKLDKRTTKQISGMAFEPLGNLLSALLHPESIEDLATWLSQNA